MSLKLKEELNSFQTIWKGGFRTGYSQKRNQKGVEEYLKRNMDGKTMLEIGCGGGQWSKFIYNLGTYDKMYCIDALSENHNNFWMFVDNEKKDKIEYYQVTDFSLDSIPDNSLDYVFSYDVFCHISYTGHLEYLKNLRKKCKKGCKLFIMYADANKYLKNEPENEYHVRRYIPNGYSYQSNDELIIGAINDKDGNASSGRWYWVGVDNFVMLCEKYGYEILNRDLDIDKTNPITLFTCV